MEENQVLDQELKRSFTFQNRELLDNYVILAVTDTEGIIKHVSTNLCNVFKYKSSEILGKPYTFLIKKDSIINFQNQFDDTRSLKTVWKGEVKHSSQSDDTIWTDTIISPLFNDDKKLVGFILASSDITKEKTLKRINEENILKKKHDKSVLDFMPSISSAILLRTPSGLHKVLWLITFTVLFLLVWSYFSKIDDIVRTEGKIITTTNIQTISSLDGGVLKEIFIKEGDRVKKGDILLKLSDLNYKTDYEKNLHNKMALLAKIERLKAQAQDKDIKINEAVVAFNKSIMDNEVELLNTNKKRFDASINILKEQLQQRKNDLSDTYKNLKITEENYQLVQKEKQIKIPLVQERIISKVELLDLQRKENDILSELRKLKGAIPTLKSSIKEIRRSIEETEEAYYSSAKDDLIVATNDLNQIKEDVSFLNEKIIETTIKAPHDGVVNRINIKTRGEAVPSGKVIAEIIPDTDYLLAEVKIDPADIGFLFVGQDVRLKLRPYDFTLYGAVDAKINYISADTIKSETEKNKEYYIVQIKSKTKYLKDNKNLSVKPGMTVDADIITGKKSILSYILKPIVRSLEI